MQGFLIGDLPSCVMWKTEEVEDDGDWISNLFGGVCMMLLLCINGLLE